jgi:hypothetical protein
MPQRKYPRIEIDQRAYDALQAEGILQHRTVREIATEAILGHISTEAIEFIDRKTKGPKTAKPEDIATERPQDHKTDKDECGAVTVADKRKRLFENPDALQQIKTLWAEGVHNGTAISKKIGYPKATVAEHIKKLKEKGELSD